MRSGSQQREIEKRRHRRADTRGDSAAPPLLESLEPRVLCSGVTLITHGAQLSSSDRPVWLDAMAAAVIGRTSPDTAVYALRISRGGGSGSGPAAFESFDLLAGRPPSDPLSSNAETVILLDWADASGITTGNYNSTATIAAIVAPFLTNPIPSRGILTPLAESPIHLLGHSRGTSVVSQLAGQLGVLGIWVDQVTMFDPYPTQADPEPAVYATVTFADNYWRADGFNIFEPFDLDGKPVAGTFDVELNENVLDASGEPGFDSEHSDTHLFYFGTMNLSPSAIYDGESVPAQWYPQHGVTRETFGYHFSRVGGGNRFSGPAAAGVHPLFGVSSAARVPLNLSAATWPSLIATGANDPDLIYVAGEAIHPVAIYADVDSAAAVGFFLDADTNPYNGGEHVLGADQFISTGTNVAIAEPAYSTSGAAPGTYRLGALITDGAHTRYQYHRQSITILPDVTAPVVADVLLSGESWPQSLLDYFKTAQMGDGGYRLPIESASPIPPLLPWTNINEIVVRFSEPVVADQSMLWLSGVNNARLDPSAFAYDMATHTGTWTFAPLPLDRWLINVAGVTDAAGYPLAAGGFSYRFDLLPGDTNRSGAVLSDDLIRVRNAQFKSTASDGYDPMLDINSTGVILGDDVVLVRNRQFTTLPEGTPESVSLLTASGEEITAEAASDVQELLASAAAEFGDANRARTSVGARALSAAPVATFLLHDDVGDRRGVVNAARPMKRGYLLKLRWSWNVV